MDWLRGEIGRVFLFFSLIDNNVGRGEKKYLWSNSLEGAVATFLEAKDEVKCAQRVFLRKVGHVDDERDVLAEVLGNHLAVFVGVWV